MRTVTAVDPVWLAELGPMFFSIKTETSDVLSAKTQEKLMAKEMEREFEERLQKEADEAARRDQEVRQQQTELVSQTVASFGRAKSRKK